MSNRSVQTAPEFLSRWQLGLAVCALLGVVASSFPAAAHAYWSRPPNTRGSSEGTLIAHRLTVAKHPVVYNTSGNGPRPLAAFCTDVNFTTHHVGNVFAFCVFVYSNHATAETSYGDHLNFVERYGTPDASQFDVVGPVECWGFTGGPVLIRPGPAAPLPRGVFLAMVSLALGRSVTIGSSTTSTNTATTGTTTGSTTTTETSTASTTT